MTRGTSNKNETGSSEDRRRRRAWLLETYRADVDVIVVRYVKALDREDLSAPMLWTPKDQTDYGFASLLYDLEHDDSFEVLEPRAAACRCYRCGRLLTLLTMTVDRIVPGCKGGTYRRNNIRPACAKCNTETGAAMARGRTHQTAKKRAAARKQRRAAA